MTQIFVTPARLQEHLDDPNVVIVDGSWYLPTQNRDPEAEYLAGQTYLDPPPRELMLRNHV